MLESALSAIEAMSTQAAPKLRLVYLPVKYRAEAIRLTFYIGGVDFEDQIISYEELTKTKHVYKVLTLQPTSHFSCQPIVWASPGPLRRRRADCADHSYPAVRRPNHRVWRQISA